MTNPKSVNDEWLYANAEKKSYSPRYLLTLLLFFIVSLSFLSFRESPAIIRLGLDLRGGTTIVLQPQQTEPGLITPDAIQQALEILRQRVDGVGVSESEIRAEGTGDATKIIVSVPGTTQRELVSLVGQTAKLSIRPVLFVGSNGSTETFTFPEDVTSEMKEVYSSWNCPKETTSAVDNVTRFLIACDEAGASKYILGSTKVEGSQISDARFGLDRGALGWTTNLSFDSVGSRNFGEFSTRISALPPPRNQMAVVLDGKVVIAPRVDGPLSGGQVMIYGSFTQEYAQNLANVLKYGALPFSFRVDEVDNVSASLGASQLRSGLSAGALGLLLISIYLLFYYRVLGFLAIGSLAIAFVITLLLFIILGRFIGLTLTLAGIAGAIVSIGVTADSFIVYFERVKDEMRLGASLRVALDRGWKRAKRTVWIADVVSLIAAVVLYLFTTGNVRGFAFTLGLTTLIDLFIVYFFTRPTLVLLQRYSFFAKGHRLSGLSQASLGIISQGAKKKFLDLGALGGRLFRGEVSVDVVEKPRRWFILSGSVMLLATISLATFGLNLGLEFKGGTVNVVTAPQASADRAREVLGKIGYEGQVIVQETGGSKLRVETAQLSNEKAIELSQGLADEFGVDVASIDSRSIGPSWGAEISRKALLGIFWFIIALVIYLAFALEIRMAIAAIAAVIHDLLITVGLYSTTGLKVTPAAVIGFITILAYSLYDTVVVFDKVRENVLIMKRRSKEEYAKAVNLALNQTLIRSINTSIVAVIPIASILLVGAIFLEAETLKDISLALVIGQTIGTYSSIFIASPLLVKLNANRYSKQKQATSIDSIDELLNPTPKVERSRVEATPSSLLAGFSVKNFEIIDGPDVYRSFNQDEQAWNSLWVGNQIPVTLEYFTALARIELGKVQQDKSEIQVVRREESMEVSALLRRRKDYENSSEVIDLIAISSRQEEREFAGFIHSMLEQLENIGVSATFRMQTISLRSFLEESGLELVGQIKSGALTRSGRQDQLIFQGNLNQGLIHD